MKRIERFKNHQVYMLLRSVKTKVNARYRWLRCQMFVLVLVLTAGCRVHEQPTTQILSIANALQEHEDLSILDRISLYEKLKRTSPKGYNFENEDEMTMYGYRHLWEGDLEDALEIFKLLVREFPASANTYDSLGEAYLALGDSTNALKNYLKSLELNPDNFNAEDYIARIRHPERRIPTPREKFGFTYTVEEYQQDLDQLGAQLLKVHPAALKFTSKDEFQQLIEAKKKLIHDNTTYPEFVWHCSEIIAGINCSHTYLGSFYTEAEMLPDSLLFPIQVLWLGEKLYVVDPMANAGQISVKDEITSINGTAVPDLMEDVYRHIVSQGLVQTRKNHEFNVWSNVILPYALGLPDFYRVGVKGKPEPIVLQHSEDVSIPYWDTSLDYCEDFLCFEVDEKKHIATMTINSFNYYPWNNLDEFKRFTDSSFQVIAKQKMDHLIIDLRFNAGGSPESSIYLLQYLSDRPFSYFSKTDNSKGYGMQEPVKHGYRGQTVFLIDGNGQSTTGHFMAKVKELNLGVIVGEELGSNQFCTAGQTVLRLSHTKLIYYVANSISELEGVDFPDEHGIMPDYVVGQDIDDYLHRKDVVKEFAVRLFN